MSVLLKADQPWSIYITRLEKERGHDVCRIEQVRIPHLMAFATPAEREAREAFVGRTVINAIRDAEERGYGVSISIDVSTFTPDGATMHTPGAAAYEFWRTDQISDSGSAYETLWDQLSVQEVETWERIADAARSFADPYHAPNLSNGSRFKQGIWRPTVDDPGTPVSAVERAAAGPLKLLMPNKALTLPKKAEDQE